MSDYICPVHSIRFHSSAAYLQNCANYFMNFSEKYCKNVNIKKPNEIINANCKRLNDCNINFLLCLDYSYELWVRGE